MVWLCRIGWHAWGEWHAAVVDVERVARGEGWIDIRRGICARCGCQRFRLFPWRYE